MKLALHNYQKTGCRFVEKHKRCALHMDIGTGKTATTIAACKELLDNFDIRGVMVFAPLKVATVAWPDELRKWDEFRKLRHIVVRGSEAERIQQLRLRSDFYILNYDWLPWWVEWVRSEIQAKRQLPFDMLVLDESSKLKSPASKRFKELKPLADSNRFRRIVELTGTPSPERLQDLWSQYRLLDGGQRLMKFVTHFRDRYLEINPYNHYDIKPKDLAQEEIEKLIADITYTIRAEDYLELPRMLEHTIPIIMPKSAMKIYDEFEKDMVIKIDSGYVVGGNAGVATEKCRQIASGAVYDSNGDTRIVHSEKMDTLKEFIEDIDEPVMVAYWYKHEHATIKNEFPGVPILGPDTYDKEAARIIEDWNKGKIPLLFIHPGSVGHGINLQHGGRILVWLTIPWHNDYYRQTNGRLYRMGQTKPVLIYRMIVQDTVETLVDDVLADKEFNQQSLRKALAKYTIA